MSLRNSTAAVLLELLRDIDESARLDLNTEREDETSYEVRMFGSHVGFVYIGPYGTLKEWI